jgi:diguanylate cyclase
MADDILNDMDVEYATTVADRAIRSMSLQSVPATPNNFAVWFNYAMGTSPALRKTIDILIGNKRKFDSAINHELYVTYVNPQSNAVTAAGDFPEQLQGHRQAIPRGSHLRQCAQIEALARSRHKLRQPAIRD